MLLAAEVLQACGVWAGVEPREPTFRRMGERPARLQAPRRLQQAKASVLPARLLTPVYSLPSVPTGDAQSAAGVFGALGWGCKSQKLGRKKRQARARGGFCSFPAARPPRAARLIGASGNSGGSGDRSPRAPAEPLVSAGTVGAAASLWQGFLSVSAGSSTRPSGPAACARWPSPAAPHMARRSRPPRRPAPPRACPA